MKLFCRTRPASMPKQERSQGPVEQTLAQLNRIQREIYQRLRTGERLCSESILILDHKAAELKRKLLHEMGVFPVVDHNTGLWKLYDAD